jgi:hypothetical protein
MANLAAGDAANSKSGGKAAGHNTDGFDGQYLLIPEAIVLIYETTAYSLSVESYHRGLYRSQSRRLSCD